MFTIDKAELTRTKTVTELVPEKEEKAEEGKDKAAEEGKDKAKEEDASMEGSEGEKTPAEGEKEEAPKKEQKMKEVTKTVVTRNKLVRYWHYDNLRLHRRC